MSLIGLAMNVLLAALLLAALMMGWRLNRRLKALRDSHEGFAAAVTDLNAAAMRAEQGLADLRAATDEAVDLLADRIDKGRSLAIKLDRLVEQASFRNAPHRRPRHPRTIRWPSAASAHCWPPHARCVPSGPCLRSWRAAAADRATVGERSMLERQIARARRLAEEDLFDDEPLTLDDVRGARR